MRTPFPHSKPNEFVIEMLHQAAHEQGREITSIPQLVSELINKINHIATDMFSDGETFELLNRIDLLKTHVNCLSDFIAAGYRPMSGYAEKFETGKRDLFGNTIISTLHFSEIEALGWTLPEDEQLVKVWASMLNSNNADDVAFVWELIREDEQTYPDATDEQLEALWFKFQQVPYDEDYWTEYGTRLGGKNITERFHIWLEGENWERIEEWFNQAHSKGIEYLKEMISVE